MSGRNRIGLTMLFVLAASLFSAMFTAFILSEYYGRMQFRMLGNICQAIEKENPEAMEVVWDALKVQKTAEPVQADENILLSFGYQQGDFMELSQKNTYCITGIGFGAGSILVLIAIWYWNKKETSRIKKLTNYLEKVNTGGTDLLSAVSDDDFSRLQDEIYKTVTTIYQMRDAALEAKNNFADNLSNIAHQLKTPITAISLSAQMMKEHPAPQYLIQIHKQLSRLTHLEEALLLLSRIDAGTLTLKQERVDVFTMLTLAADNLQELFIQSGVFLDVPEMGEAEITADLDWMMEAVMNLMKNSMQHSPAGSTVHCAYEQNPLYVQVKIWDEGQGFSQDDLPHIFERFYRGKNEMSGGIGIGLPLAKKIIEMNNGALSAGNLPNGGACFEARFYSH